MLLVVLAVITAASTLAAQDTLRIESYRIVDVCSSERRWLLAVNVGSIKAADSLVSFDITIGYDKNKLLPTDVLKDGTLSAGMAYAPSLNAVIPNEMRIAGGNIIKPVVGDVPLVAVAGEFLASCNEFDTLGYPWPATFNEEFKKKFTVVRVNRVLATAKAQKYVGLGYKGVQDTVKLHEDSSGALTATLFGDLRVDSLFTLTLEYDTSLIDVRISDTPGSKVVSNSTMKTGQSWTIQHENASRQVEVSVTSRRLRVDSQTVIRMTTQMSQTCSCIAPGESDSVVIVSVKPVVSVSSFDERIDGIRFEYENLFVQCDHEEMKNVSIYTVTGVNVFSTDLPAEQRSVSCSFLPSGPYLVKCSCGNNNHVKMILK